MNSSKTLSSFLAGALCLSALTLTSCSSSSSDGGTVQVSSASSLPGYWKVWTTLAGQAERGPDVLFFSVVNSAVTGPNMTGSVNGNSFQFVEQGNGDSTAVDGTLTGETIGNGTYTTTRAGGGSETGSFRMEKFVPSGSFSITGTIFGAVVTHTSTTAVGVRDYIDPAKTQLREIEVITGSTVLDFELDIEPQNLAIGQRRVGSAAGDVSMAVEFSNGPIAARAVALSGTFDVTKYDDTGLTATFTLNLDSGDTVTGTIDVAFDIDAMDP